jgi:dipeptidyl aminopeptidase/acylaminoacyl peptidase
MTAASKGSVAMPRGRGALVLAAALTCAACGGVGERGGAAVRTAPSVAPDEKPRSASAPVPLIPREVLFGNPVKTAPKLSPDGKRMAYLAPHGGVLNVFVKTVGKDDDKVVTDDKLRGIHHYEWAANGRLILYSQDRGGDENWRVYVVPATGGVARDLTPLDKVQARVVAVEHRVPDKILVALNDRDPRLHDVHEVDLASGQRKLVALNDIGAVNWIADHRLRVRAAEVLTPDGGTVLLHRPGRTGQWKRLARWKAEDLFTTTAHKFAGNDRDLYMLTSVGSNTVELRRLDTRTGREETLATDPQSDVTWLITDPRTDEVVAVGFGRARLEWKVLRDDVAEDVAAMQKLGDGDTVVLSTDKADRSWLVGIDNDDGPQRVFSYDRKSKQGRLLFTVRPELEDLTLAEMKPVSYRARDGLTIHGYLTLPPRVPPRQLPAVVVPHGGPWDRDQWGHHHVPQWLANRGYAVLQPNFRGSTGYGKKFLNAANREWGGKMQDDITDGTRWLIDQGIADPERICIMGTSYGGYATLMGLAREPELYACGVDIIGIANLVTWLETIPPSWAPFRHVLHQRVGHPKKDAEFLKSRSPVFLADRIRAPLLIAQGAGDPRGPRSEAIQIRDALLEAGKKVEYMEFADEGHDLARPENRLRFFAAAERFLARYLGGRVQP